MAKNNNMILIIGIIIVILIAYGGNAGWFSSISTTTITNPQTIQKLENSQTTTETCSLNLDKSTMDSGDSITGTIKAEPNNGCQAFAKINGVWSAVFEGITDASGNLVKAEKIDAVGIYIFKAICGNCVTNERTLTVNPSAATDTDGDGTPDESDWDDDNDGVGDAEEIVAGTDPLNPNDYPGSPTPSCSETDDGLDLIQFGVCTDTVSSYTDGCPRGEGVGWVTESYCSNNFCVVIETECPPGWLCENSRCQFPEQPEQPDRYDLLTCTVVARVVSGYDSSFYTINDIDFAGCRDSAISSCVSAGKDFGDSQDFPPNCCGFSCGDCETDACCQGVISETSWDFTEAGYTTNQVGDCMVWAEIQCNDLNGLVAHNVIDGCCVWECWGS